MPGGTVLGPGGKALLSKSLWKWKSVAKLCPSLLLIPWTAAHQAPLPMGFPRKEWAALQHCTPANPRKVSFSRGSSWPRDQTHVSCLAGRFFTTEPPGKYHQSSAYSQMYVTSGSKSISWDVWWQSGLRRSSGLKVQRVEEGGCSLEKMIRDGLFKELHLSKDLPGRRREPRDNPGRWWHSGPWNQERASVLGKQRGDWWGRVWAQEGRAVDETSVIREASLRRPRTLCKGL